MRTSTTKVPTELVPMFGAEAKATARHAAQGYDEASRLRPEEAEGAKAVLTGALELEGKDHGPGEVEASTTALASTARGVLLTLAEQLEDAANRAPLPAGEVTELAQLIEVWAPEVARLEGEVS